MIAELSRELFAPDALDSAIQGVVRLPQFKRAAQMLDEFLARFHLLRRDAEPQMQLGRGPPRPALVICSTTASPPRPEKSLAKASVQGNLGLSAVPRQMRRLFGPRGGVVRWGGLAATDADVNSNGGDDFAA